MRRESSARSIWFRPPAEARRMGAGLGPGLVHRLLSNMRRPV